MGGHRNEAALDGLADAIKFNWSEDAQTQKVIIHIADWSNWNRHN